MRRALRRETVPGSSDLLSWLSTVEISTSPDIHSVQELVLCNLRINAKSLLTVLSTHHHQVPLFCCNVMLFCCRHCYRESPSLSIFSFSFAICHP